jgi:hypothetical protein
MAAYVAVMANMHTGHQQATGAEPSNPASANCSPADGYIFADRVVIADFCFRRLTAILQILRRNSDCAEGMKDVARTDSRPAI